MARQPRPIAQERCPGKRCLTIICLQHRHPVQGRHARGVLFLHSVESKKCMATKWCVLLAFILKLPIEGSNYGVQVFETQRGKLVEHNKSTLAVNPDLSDRAMDEDEKAFHRAQWEQVVTPFSDRAHYFALAFAYALPCAGS
eukprot:scaffold95131_cov14-Tisochrysis_lutea.AAC.3